MKREQHLLVVTDAFDLVRLGFRPGKRRQKHSCENRDDGDHHQEFYEREAAVSNWA
jgi:hypothetical protein